MEIYLLLEIHACRNPRLTDKTIIFSEHEVFKLSCHGNTIILLRMILKLKTPRKLSLLITKFSISPT